METPDCKVTLKSKDTVYFLASDPDQSLTLGGTGQTDAGEHVPARQLSKSRTTGVGNNDEM
jgi:hypothetical protein